MNWDAKWGSVPIYVSLVEWADRIISDDRTALF
jgi:hypothetical protein